MNHARHVPRQPRPKGAASASSSSSSSSSSSAATGIDVALAALAAAPPVTTEDEDRRRREVYAMNAILRKIEHEKFEQLKADVAVGKEVIALDTSCHSEYSSGSPSPSNRTSAPAQNNTDHLRSRSAGVSETKSARRGGGGGSAAAPPSAGGVDHVAERSRSSSLGGSQASSLRAMSLRFGGV